MVCCVRLQGHVSKQMQQVGNAVPMLLAWAIFGAVFEAAYGVSAPLPDFVKQRQIAAGKRAADAPAEEASLETLSMEGNSFSVAKEAAMPCCQMCEETAFWLSR